MSKLRLYIAAFATLGTAACTGDFLDLLPPSTIVVENLYRTDQDFDQAVLGVYAAIRGQYTNMWMVGDLRADDVWQQQQNQTGPVNTDIFSAHTAAAGIWNAGYQTIHRANTILEKIQDADVPNKARYVAEAKFLRALAYFNIVRTFGDAVLLTRPVLPEEAMKIGRSPVATIYSEVIIPDLVEAGAVLPESYSGASVGRATRGAAKALLGKVYLTIGEYQAAEQTLLEVTTMGYQLLSDYEKLYDWNGEKHHSEYIFDIEYSSSPSIPGSTWTNLFAPNWLTFRNHYGVPGTLGDQFTPTRQFRDLFEEGDRRKAISVADGITTDDGVFHPLPPNLAELITLKYAVSIPSANNSNANWIVLRYADVLLMLAEAMNENGKTAEAHAYINQVRARAGLPDLVGLTQQEMRAAIEKERRLEFNGEGHRWFDLVRWGKAYEVLAPLGMQPYMVLWPIPQQQIDIIGDPTIMWQNPGYGEGD